MTGLPGDRPDILTAAVNRDPVLSPAHRYPIPKRSPARVEAIALLEVIIRAAVAMPWEHPATDGAEDIADAAIVLARLIGLDITNPLGGPDDPNFR